MSVIAYRDGREELGMAKSFFSRDRGEVVYRAADFPESRDPGKQNVGWPCQASTHTCSTTLHVHGVTKSFFS